jgi:hydrogenase nickel incorporation protein HypA/HybF
MHELSVAQDILEIVRQYVPRDQEQEVRRIRLRVGTLSGIVPDSLEFCFAAIVSDTPLAKATLSIERVPTRTDCPDCGNSSVVENPVFICEACGSAAVRVISGTELQVLEIELGDQEAEAV